MKTNKEAYGIIYKVNGPTGKIYIGQTIKSLKLRKRQHSYMANKKDHRTAFQIAILEFGGVDAFTWEQIDEAENQVELDTKEKQWIAFYNSNNADKGYNTFSGGKDAKHTPETRRKMSEAKSGLKNHNFGKSKSAETRRKISEALKGINNPNFGKPIPNEIRQKMSDAHKGDKNPAAKLTENQVRQIKMALANGETGSSLAKRYKISVQTVSKIKTGLKWSHIKIIA